MQSTQKPILMIDVDGVVVIGKNLERDNWASTIEQDLGFPVTALRQHFFKPHWADIVTGRNQLLPRLQEALVAIGTSCSAEELRDYWFANDAQIDRTFCAWMTKMRRNGHRVLLATNQEHCRADHLMTTLNLQEHCDGIYYSAALGVTKSERAFFDKVVASENCNPHDCILVDDTLSNVTCALGVGWQGIHYTGQSSDQLTTAIVSGD